MRFPTPAELGLPAKFKVWRPNQPRVIQDAIDCDRRAKIQMQRAGAGKSVSYIAAALMKPNIRAAILTVNKALQDQLLEDFGGIGLVDIRGKDSPEYQCQGRVGMSCGAGMLAKCCFKGSGVCPWSAAKQAAGEARLLSTNYPCWMASNKYGNGFGSFDLLILDEAHEAADQLARAMQVKISENDLELIQGDWPDHRSRDDMQAWKHWSLVNRKLADFRVSDLEGEIAKEAKPQRTKIDRLRQLKNLGRKLADIATCQPDNWVVDDWSHGFQFDPIEPGSYAERLLLCRIPSIIATSGTIQPKTVDSLGLGEDDYEFFEYPSTINISRSPMYWLPTMKVNRHAQEWELVKYLVATIDRIIEARIDRKGIIHTTNNRVRDLIIRHSRYSRYMLSNYSRESDLFGGQTTGALIANFKRMGAPAWFVSPSIGTGIDLPYDDCRVQICAKLPFADSSTKVERERDHLDPKRGIFHMWQKLGQQFGRGDRAEDDWQEFFILDDLIRFFMWRHSDLAPASILPYYRPIREIPPAPDLETGAAA